MNSTACTQSHNRAKTWQIAFFACNNTATNLYMYLMNYVAYYATGYLGLSVMLISNLLMLMRIWDGVTDPFIGMLLDKTSGKLGKNRPFIIVGQLVLMSGAFLIYEMLVKAPAALHLPLFILVYAIYIIGYTCQCVVTKSAQTCMTSDPKQRPTFSIFDGLYSALMWALLPVFISKVWKPRYGGFNQEFFTHFLTVVVIASAILSTLALIGLWQKDRPEYFGLGEKKTMAQQLTLRDYWDVMKNNRAIQMLVLAGASDKLSNQITTNATVSVIVFGIICGNYELYGNISIFTLIPNLILLVLGMKLVASRMGQKQALLTGSIGAIIFTSCNILLMIFGDPTTLSFKNWNLFSVLFIVFTIGARGFSQLSNAIVIPMTADCADYEVYRSGRYVPGLMGTLFSFVDKVISSFSTAIVGVFCAAIGFTEALPTTDTPYSTSLFVVGLLMLYGMPMIGWTCNLVAMHFYPLNKEKMENIQSEIARIKAESQLEE